MFQGLALPFAIETQRSSLVRVPVRNLVATTGDDILIAVSVFEPDGSYTDISGGAITLTLRRAHEDPGGHSGWWGGSSGYGSGGWSSDCNDYGWFYAGNLCYQTTATLTDPECGQAILTIPRLASESWRGRYHMMVSLNSEYGGSVQTLGILDVRRGARVAVLGTAGYVSIADAVLSPAPYGPGLLDRVAVLDSAGVGVADPTGAPPLVIYGVNGPAPNIYHTPVTPGIVDQIAVPNSDVYGIGVPTSTPFGWPMIATFAVTLDTPAQQTCVVNWQTVDGVATAPRDYDEASGTLTFLPGQTSQNIVVMTHSSGKFYEFGQFSVHLSASNGAVIVQADATATLEGWVGILDDVFLVDGTQPQFVPGLVGVTP